MGRVYSGSVIVMMGCGIGWMVVEVEVVMRVEAVRKVMVMVVVKAEGKYEEYIQYINLRGHECYVIVSNHFLYIFFQLSVVKR